MRKALSICILLATVVFFTGIANADQSTDATEAWAKKQQEQKQRQKDLNKLRNTPPAEIQSDVSRNKAQTSKPLSDPKAAIRQ